jgi:tetratricopeptide (TPR) repeat protein
MGVSIGQLILSMKDLRSNRPEPISCSIQNFGSIMSITGIYQDVQDTKKIFAWEARNSSLKQNNAINEPIILLIEDLAFQITYSLGKSKSKTNETYPQNWLTFKRLLQSREAYKTYLENGRLEYLNKSMDLLSLAYLLEPHYEGSLRRIMHYNLGLAYLSEKEYTKSMELFENLSVLEPEIGYYGLALAYYGDKDLENALNYVNTVIVLNSEKECQCMDDKGTYFSIERGLCKCNQEPG